MNRIKAILCGLFLAMLLIACGHEHTWSEATCDTPKTCTECGETEGEPLGHTTDMGKCSRCNEVFGADVFKDIVDKVASAEDDYNKSFNAIVYSGATSVSQFKSAVDANSQGFESYTKKIKEAAEMCGDYDLLSDYKSKLLDATTGLPTSMSGTDDKSFDDYMDKLEKHALKLYSYQMAELPIYDELNVKARTIKY